MNRRTHSPNSIRSRVLCISIGDSYIYERDQVDVNDPLGQEVRIPVLFEIGYLSKIVHSYLNSNIKFKNLGNIIKIKDILCFSFYRFFVY